MSSLPDPGPAEAVNHGPPSEPRPAATVVLMRDSEDDGSLEILLLKRTEKARFMPGVWVFPGGALDPEDGEGESGLLNCARRELAEEAGIELHPEAELVPLSRWITPEVIQTRFDTWFFLGLCPPGASVRPDGEEMTAAQWVRPAAALELHRTEGLELHFPTIRQLEAIAGHRDSGDAFEAARANPEAILPILPKVVGNEREFRVLVPGDDGYPND
ncbi:MAG: NUDIX hydrolase [Ilumatobacteraceae bacterium]